MAIKTAQHPYIIQIDGDVILDPHFVEDHLKFAKKGRLIAGRRIRLTKEQTSLFCMTRKYQIEDHFRNRTIAIFHQLALYKNTSIKGIRGCNMSYWREDAITINGYNEEWSGKGPDDKEFALRMVHLGIKTYNLKFYANQYHLHHGEEGLLDNYAINQDRLKDTIKHKTIKCKKGIKIN